MRYLLFLKANALLAAVKNPLPKENASGVLYRLPLDQGADPEGPIQYGLP